ncbi:MAG: hypothetical protein DRH04_06575 [Deltaproteobacteria bacterium]|nr:MAG: hypothetical protein DRH04_06575 [Deltaproteobacteria bacterium]
MARSLRIQYPGAFYHVMHRGNGGREIFVDDVDRFSFLDFLARSIDIYDIRLHCYVLMGNHFHLLVETPRGNLSEFMRHFNISYTAYFNKRYRRIGHLYQGRYKSVLVEQESFLTMVSRYIHLNPVRIKTFQEASVEELMAYLHDYQWSSFNGYVEEEDGTDERVNVCHELVLEEYGGNTREGRLAYRRQIFMDLAENLDIKDKVVGQSIIGTESFVRWIKNSFLSQGKDREQPAVRKVYSRLAQGDILAVISAETGVDLDQLKRRGVERQIAMDLLYRLGGLKGVEIGRLLGVDYTTVSQSRKRLRERRKKDAELDALVRSIENKLSTIKI